MTSLPFCISSENSESNFNLITIHQVCQISILTNLNLYGPCWKFENCSLGCLLYIPIEIFLSNQFGLPNFVCISEPFVKGTL